MLRRMPEIAIIHISILSKSATQTLLVTIVGVRCVNTYSRIQLYLRNLQQLHVSALYAGHHQVLVGLTA